MKEQIKHLIEQKKLIVNALQKTMLPTDPHQDQIDQAFAGALDVLQENHMKDDLAQEAKKIDEKLSEEITHCISQQKAFLTELKDKQKPKSGFSTDYRDFNWIILQIQMRINRELRAYDKLLKKI